MLHIAADGISFAAAFYSKSFLTYSVVAPLKITTAMLGCDFVLSANLKAVESIQLRRYKQGAKLFQDKRILSILPQRIRWKRRSASDRTYVSFTGCSFHFVFSLDGSRRFLSGMRNQTGNF